MSNWDNLYVATTLDADEVMDVFLECLPDEAKSDFEQNAKSPDLAVVNIASTMIDVRRIEHVEDLVSSIQELAPTIELTFDTKKSLAHDYIYLATLKIIRDKGWDVVLTRDDGIVILVYINGELTLKKDDIFLTQKRLEMIDMPYKTG